LTALDALIAAGVLVAAGGDNVQDPFNPMGKADPLEAASLLVTAGHLDVAVAFGAVSDSGRRVMGIDARGISEGAPADLVAVPGQTLREAMAEADPRRIVVRRGEVVDAAALAELTDGWRPERQVVRV
jgi:cytosine deaminase